MRIVRWILLALIVAIGLLAGGVVGNRLPLDEPPGKVVRLYTYLNTHVAETKEGHPFAELRPHHYTLPPDELWGKVKAAVGALPRWQIVSADDTRHELHAVVTSRLFRFKDDVTVRIERKGEGATPAVLVRAESRVGQGDLGTNTRHILDLYQQLEALGAHGAVERMSRTGAASAVAPSA